MKALFLLLFVLGLGSARQLSAQGDPPRTALVMGVGDYGGAKYKGKTIQNLPGITTVDLPGMAAKLQSLGFTVTVLANPTLSQAKGAVDGFSARLKAAPGVSLFYFSGHGGEYEGKNYLIPRGASIASTADLSDEALSAQRVLNGMEESGAQVNLVFLDCCREDLGKSVGGAEMAPLRARGSFIGFATRSGDFADPGEEGSPYTRFLLKHLDRPGLSVSDMYGFVARDVGEYSKDVLGEERRPGFYSELAGEPFFFVPASLGKTAPSAPAVPMAPSAPASVPSGPGIATKGSPYVNSLGQKFVPAGTPGILFSVYETRVKDFEAFVEATGYDAITSTPNGVPAYTYEKKKDGSGVEWRQEGGSWRDPRFPSTAGQSGEHPVVCTSYLDAEHFCEWLTKREREAGKIPASARYRLPTDEEWSRANGGGEHPWGDEYPPKSGDGNYSGKEAMIGVLEGYTDDLVKAGRRDVAARTAAVGLFRENWHGLYDLGGNVWEWCSTWYTEGLNDREALEAVPVLKDDGGGQKYRVVRGGSWSDDGRVLLRSAYRDRGDPRNRGDLNGFRCVLAVSGG